MDRQKAARQPRHPLQGVRLQGGSDLTAPLLRNSDHGRLQGPFPNGRALSEREQEVLELVAAGQSTATIASSFGLSVHTVRNHIRNILCKFGAHSKLEAVVMAANADLIK